MSISENKLKMLLKKGSLKAMIDLIELLINEVDLNPFIDSIERVCAGYLLDYYQPLLAGKPFELIADTKVLSCLTSYFVINALHAKTREKNLYEFLCVLKSLEPSNEPMLSIKEAEELIDLVDNFGAKNLVKQNTFERPFTTFFLPYRIGRSKFYLLELSTSNNPSE